MKVRGLLSCCAGVILMLGMVVPARSGGDKPRKQLELTLLGCPTSEKPEAARHISELALFGDRLYLGHGDFAVNTGSTDVIYYDFLTKEFKTEFTVDEEEINCYRILDGLLVIPGLDAMEDWSFGNLYVREASGWKKWRTLPRAIHVFDVLSYHGRWYAITHGWFDFPYGLEETPGVGIILSSGDQGATWRLEYATPCEKNSYSGFGPLASYQGKLYAFPNAMKISSGSGTPVIDDCLGASDAVVYDGDLWRPVDLIPEPHVLEIRPFRVKEGLGLWVTLGHKSSAGVLRKVERRLYRWDGKRLRRRRAGFKFFFDVLEKADKTFFLIEQDDLWTIAETGDLAHWRYYAIPPGVGEPRSIEFDGERFFIGTADGCIYQSEVVR